MREQAAKTILIVDDQPAARYAMARVLKAQGFNIIEAATGSEALRAMQDQRPDLAILDVHLPDMLGFEVCSRIKSDPSMRVVPVLHVSASYAKDRDKAHGLNCGADGYLTHPVEPAVLVATVRSLLRIRTVEDDLRELNETLESRVAERTAEAERRADQVRSLAFDLTQAERRERRRLAQMLHDHIQQLLVAAKLKVGLLQGKLDDDVQKQMARDVDALLDQVLTDSRSLNTQLSPRVLFEGGLEPALRWLAHEMEQRYDLRVDVDVAANTEPAAEEPRILAFEAVRELLFNVVKHAQAKEARVDVRKDAEDLVIIVEDRGVGFVPGQADKPSRRGHFGLPSIRQRLQLLGGGLTIDSDAGRGTRITLRFASFSPSDAQLIPEPQASNGRYGHGGLATAPIPGSHPCGGDGLTRLLLVDDHKIVREGLKSLLEAESGIEVVGEASNGVEALARARELAPHVILMDVTMPHMDGIEATRQIHSEHPHICIIGLTMHGEPDVAASMKEAGAVDFLPKGVAAETMLQVIRQVVQPAAEG